MGYLDLNARMSDYLTCVLLNLPVVCVHVIKLRKVLLIIIDL